MSQITTHILDTTHGKPASGVDVILFFHDEEEWKTIGSGSTNKDGRITDLTEENKSLKPGIYKLKFETKDYFDHKKIAAFYPYIEIIFQVTGSEHYHVPLLLNPFGYSTYRGS